MQTKLKELSYYAGAIDGKEFRTDGKESNTTKGIKLFQQSQDLPVSGVVDVRTWDALMGKKEDPSTWDKIMAHIGVEQMAGAIKPRPERGWGSESGKVLRGAKEGVTEDICTETNISYSIDNAVAALNQNAKASSTGYCARYVRMAINAGGIATPNNPISAKDYKGYLEQFGFRQITTDNFQKGDIAVMESFTGIYKDHPHGHIQMWNGTQWISDFKQRWKLED